jgi:PLP dependent protein
VTVDVAFADRLAAVRDRIAAACARGGRAVADVTLVAVTKTVDVDVAAAVVGLGIADLGESRPQELWRKHAAVGGGRFHLIGHLQRNKLERTVPLCALIHSVDSERLLTALHEFGTHRGTPVPVLLEVNCSREAAKGGFAPEALAAVCATRVQRPGVQVQGLMTMAAHHADPDACRPTFRELRTLRDSLATRYGPLPHLSMGMSNDFEVAIEEGATLVRLGSVLFDGL